MAFVDRKEQLSDGVRALFERSGLTSEAELARRAGLSHEVVTDVLAGRRTDLESTVACLRGMGADLRDLLGAMSGIPNASAVEGSSAVSILTGLEHAPRAIDLLQDAKRLLGEARRLRSERPVDLETVVDALGQAVAGLEQVVGSDARRLWQEAEELAAAPGEELLSEEEFESALKRLHSLVLRASGEESARRPPSSPFPDRPSDDEGSP